MSQLQQNRLLERFYDEPFALCFSGQGFDWISSLREALADGARDRANEVVAAAARILAPVAGQIAAARPQGFEPIKWVENGADGIDLVRAAVSAPGIFLSQIANLSTLETRGLDSGKAAGVIGHSQGILGRYLMREPQHAAELLALTELIGATATLQGRATGMYLHDGLHPMVMVQGVSRGQIAAVLDELFPVDSADRPCIGLQNSTDGFVVSGKPESVARVCGVLSDTVKDANGQTPENLLWRLDVEVGFHHTPPCCPPWRKWPNGRQPAVWMRNRRAASRKMCWSIPWTGRPNAAAWPSWAYGGFWKSAPPAAWPC